MGSSRAAPRIVRQAAAGARVTAAGIAMRGGERLGDVGPGAEAGIDQPLLLQPLQRLGVQRRAFRLDDRLAVEANAEPVEIFKDAFNEFRPAAAGIQILDADPEFSAAGPRMGMTQRRRKGVAQMEPAGRRGGETCDFQDSLHGKGDRGDS